MAVEPVHVALFVAVHWTQAPLAEQALRSGAPSATQSASAAHAWHVRALLQMGRAPPQVADVVHSTQRLAVVSHAGVAPAHAAPAAAVHCTHWPSERQAGNVGSLIWHCRSAEHGAHALVARSQIGAAAVHWRSAVHSTQRPDAGSQIDVGAAQALMPAA